MTRIRRGRFYKAGDSQPHQCRTYPHPAIPHESIAPDIHIVPKSLEVFYGNPIWYEYIQGKKALPLVLLGMDERFTVWTITDVEAISTGEDLVTLKARSSFGILPYINKEAVPKEYLSK